MRSREWLHDLGVRLFAICGLAFPKPFRRSVGRGVRTDFEHLLRLRLREGVGGYPLLLIHGYPETKRIWWRNVEPLANAGYEVIVPDLRGYGESLGPPPDPDHLNHSKRVMAEDMVAVMA